MESLQDRLSTGLLITMVVLDYKIRIGHTERAS